jgi:hypothetical protein
MSRTVLRSWYERHTAFYEVISAGSDAVETLNLINDQPYRIRHNLPNPFQPEQLVYGSTVPASGFRLLAPGFSVIVPMTRSEPRRRG